MRNLDYGDFSEALHQKAIAGRLPLDGSLELTPRCNLTCAHCYINLPVADREARRRELSLEEIRRLLDEVADAGCLSLLLTGGEVLVRPDFFDIYLYAMRKGFLLTIYTNGTMITPRKADIFAEWRPFKIEITLYGATQATYERVTGIPGSYAKCVQGIDLLVERGVPLELKTVVMKLNKHELALMDAFAEQRGLPFRFDSVITPRLDCSQAPLAQRLSPHEVVELDMADPKRVQAWREVSHGWEMAAESDALFTCGAGLHTFHIDAFGQMFLCMDLRHPDFMYDLRNGTFEEGYYQFFLKVRARKRTRPHASRLEQTNLCDACPAKNWMETGDPEVAAPYLLQIADLRAAALKEMAGIPMEVGRHVGAR